MSRRTLPDPNQWEFLPGVGATSNGPDSTQVDGPEGSIDHQLASPYVADPGASVEKYATSEEEFAAKFGWTPHWKAEVTLALEGLEPRINRQPIMGAEHTLENVDGYIKESSYDTYLLGGALIIPKQVDTLSPQAIRYERKILRVIAKGLLFHNALGKAKWPVRKKNSLEDKLNPLIDELATEPDEALVGLWNGAYSDVIARADYWRGELTNVENNTKVERMRSEIRQRLWSHHR